MRPEDEYKLRSKSQRWDVPVTTGTSIDPYAQRERHGCLTIWLYLYVIASVITFFILLPYLERALRVMPLPTFVLLFTIVAEGVSAYFVLQWKRWAVNALVVSSVVSLVLEVFIGVAQLKDYVNTLVALGILYYFVHPHLDDYE